MTSRSEFSPLQAGNAGDKIKNCIKQNAIVTKHKFSQFSKVTAAVLLAFSAPNYAFSEALLAHQDPVQKTGSTLNTKLEDTLPLDATSTKAIERIEVVGQINTGLMESEIKLANTSSPDLRSQLSQLPGVSVNGNGLVSGIVQYRGLFGDRLKVKIDGLEIAGAGPNAMDSPLSHALGNNQIVTLYQGIAPVSVGYETLAGAIEIKDARPILGESSAFDARSTLSASWFSNNEAKMLDANVAVANNENYLSFQGQFQEADNYSSGNGDVVPSTFYERSGLKFSAARYTDDYELEFLVGNRNTNESGTPALAMDISFVDSAWYKFGLAKNLGNDWKASAKIFGNQNEHIMTNFDLRFTPSPAAHRKNTVESEAVGMDIDIAQTSVQNNWKFGANYYSQVHDSRITNPNNIAFFIQNFTNVQREVGSLYAEYDIAANPFNSPNKNNNVQWQLGGRATQVAYDADEVGSNMAMMNPNVAALVNDVNGSDRAVDFDLFDLVTKAETRINDHLQATLSFGQKERAPSYQELYSWFPLGVSAGLADGRNYLGNLNLEKETAGQIDAGLQLQHNGLTVMGNIFYHSIDNYIIGVPSTNMSANMIATMMGAQQPLQWDNRKAKLHGADLYVSKTIGSHWQATLSAQWVDAKLSESIDGERYPLYRIAPLSGNIALHWSKEALDVSLSVNLADAQNDVSSLQNETATSGYAVWNLNMHYRMTPALTLSLIAENLLDKEYAQHLGGVNRVADSEVAVGKKVPEIGRNIGLHAEYAF
jgi:iron complex outermembrane receptor protein